ncbi:MAG: hypothetical protein AB1918_17855 [Pseudomonadota bacterium]
MARMVTMAAALLLAAAGADARTELTPFGHLPGPTGPAEAWRQGDPPLFEGLGDMGMDITTAHPRAQAYFDQGLRWAWAFNHAEAVRAFREAQDIDPACAMCAWGEALALGPNINKPMDPADLPAALAAVNRARALAPDASPREQALVAALARRYTPDGPDDQAYARAMLDVARAHPGNDDIQVLAAEAMMDTQPWDYWEADGRTPKGYTEAVVATLERVLADNPDHAGAIHLYIHAVEATGDAARALPHARRLAGLMPAAGHIVHMPSHIYYRLGMWRESLEQNKKAVAADQLYFAQVGTPPGIYRDGYAPHNLHFVMVSAQMAGDAVAALDAADRLAATVTEDAARRVPWSQPIKAAPYFTHAQFSDPDAILAIADPGEGLPYVAAMWRYARGVAQAAKGDSQAARAEGEAIRRLGASPAIAELDGQGVPASSVLNLAARMVAGLAARAEGDFTVAVAELREAAAIEDQLSYTEPPWWYAPVRQTLGATLLMAGDPAAAEAEFLRSLEDVPNNGWALYGLMQAQAALSKDKAAADTARRFRQAWAAGQAPQLAGL